MNFDVHVNKNENVHSKGKIFRILIKLKVAVI